MMLWTGSTYCRLTRRIRQTKSARGILNLLLFRVWSLKLNRNMIFSATAIFPQKLDVIFVISRTFHQQCFHGNVQSKRFSHNTFFAHQGCTARNLRNISTLYIVKNKQWTFHGYHAQVATTPRKFIRKVNRNNISRLKKIITSGECIAKEDNLSQTYWLRNVISIFYSKPPK